MTPTIPTQNPPAGQPPPTNDEIVKKYGDQLKSLVEKNCLEAIDKEKIFQHAVCRRNDFYYRGNQHLVPTFASNGEVVDFKPINSQMLLTSGDESQQVVYDYVINHFRGDMRKLVGVLGNKSPNCKALPDWGSDETGIRRSNIATDCISYLDGQWDVDAANRALVLSLGKNGTSFIHTPYVTDADRYGTFTEPVWGTRPEQVTPDAYRCMMCGADTPGDQAAPPPACQQCGAPLGPQDFMPGETQDVPAIVDQKEYPNGTVELSIHSGYDVNTPFFVKDMEHCPWLELGYDDDAAWLVSKFPGVGLEELLKDDSYGVEGMTGSSAQMGRTIRDQASSPTGYTAYQHPNRWRYSRIWIRPSMYLYLLKSGGENKGTIELLKKQFKTGMKLSFVRGKLVRVEGERLDEVWAAVKPETSEFLYADPLFNDYVQIADVVNDFLNICIQLGETSIPALLYDPNVLTKNKIKRGFQPNEFIPVNPGMMSDKSFFRIPTAEPSAEIIEFIKDLVSTGRELIGLLPAIWGGDAVPNETAEAARRRLNQALMVLSTTWNEMRGGWAKARRNGVRQLARYSLGRLVSSQGDAESVSVQEINDIEELLKGGWHTVCDQAIPMNWTQLRDFIQDMFNMSPDAQHTLGLDDPENSEAMNQAVGIPGWKIRGKDERDRIHDLIGRLMKESPVQGAPIIGPDGMQQPGDPEPSIQPDFQMVYTPNLFIQVVHDWLNTEEGRSAEGAPGYQNVIAAGLAAIKFMQPPPAPMPGPPSKGALPPAGGAPTLPETLPGANAPTQPEAPLPPLPQQTTLLNQPPQGAVQ